MVSLRDEAARNARDGEGRVVFEQAAHAHAADEAHPVAPLLFS